MSPPRYSRVAILADPHIGGPGGSGESLIGQIDDLASSNCDLLLVLGDLFQWWVGEERFATDTVRRVMAAFERLHARGVPAVFIEGNRDFFVAGGSYARLFEFIGLGFAFEVDGVRYLAVHGDGLNARDWRYRLWRGLSKSFLTRSVLAVLPASLCLRLMESTERRLSETNFDHKSRIPREVIESYAERRLREGYDVLLLGHFHDDLCFEVGRGQARILPAWYADQDLIWLGGMDD